MALVGEGKKTADRPLRVGIINIMPRAETYEANLLRPLADAPSVVEPIWIRLGSHVYSSSDARHIARRYVTFQEATGHAALDGLILTGAPVEELPFEAVHYWSELEAILQQARRSISSTLGLCWGGLALAKQLDIDKELLPKKLFGVFQNRSLSLEVGVVGDPFWCAHSRHSGIRDDRTSRRAARRRAGEPLLSHARPKRAIRSSRAPTVATSCTSATRSMTSIVWRSNGSATGHLVGPTSKPPGTSIPSRRRRSGDLIARACSHAGLPRYVRFRSCPNPTRMAAWARRRSESERGRPRIAWPLRCRRAGEDRYRPYTITSWQFGASEPPRVPRRCAACWRSFPCRSPGPSSSLWSPTVNFMDPLSTTTISRVPGPCGSDAWRALAVSRSSYISSWGIPRAGIRGRLSNFPSSDRSNCVSPRRRTDSPVCVSPIRSENATPRPAEIFQRTPIVRVEAFRVSICESAARLTPVSCASWSSDKSRRLRCSRRTGFRHADGQRPQLRFWSPSLAGMGDPRRAAAAVFLGIAKRYHV